METTYRTNSPDFTKTKCFERITNSRKFVSLHGSSIQSFSPLWIDQNPLTPRYIIDFDPQLNEMMTEARYLEQFDYVLPENIRHLALSVSLILLVEFLFPKINKSPRKTKWNNYQLNWKSYWRIITVWLIHSTFTNNLYSKRIYVS